MSNLPLQHVDYLIIGQGLAGSLLAWELIQKGQRVLVVDNGKTSASQIAAGLINPITGMRLVKTSNLDVLLPAAKNYYHYLEHFFKQSFLIEKPMLRILRNRQEKQYGEKRLNDPSYRPYVSGLQLKADSIKLSSSFGILQQKQTGFLLTRHLLAKIKEYLQQTNQYLKTNLDYQDIKIQANKAYWKNIESSRIIFCEGYHGQNNPWFSWLPFSPVKGEILTLTSQQQLPDYLLNYGFWLIPTDHNSFRTGATFDRENIDTKATNQASKILLEAINQFAPNISIERIIDHQAHIRPATKDRFPFLGCHPAIPELCIFNGFGSKGSLQIPWCADQFSKNLMHSSPLPESLKIDRHYDQYFSTPSIA